MTIAQATPAQHLLNDTLDRLTVAHYGIQDENEVFTMDELGNRSNVKLRSDANEVYVVDANTNRYASIDSASIDSNSLTYDAAGNITQDKQGYVYSYDYENRLVKVIKSGNDVAEFAYDALGRRVRKIIASDPNENVLYYYNNNWQVLMELWPNKTGSDSRRSYLYGNYIDEVLLMDKPAGRPAIYPMYYVHDHLYSPAALVNRLGSVVECYEYDAYGQPTFWDSSFTTEYNEPGYQNPYVFTGRRIDIFENGALKLQYNRNRYYSYSMGRWLTHDPLGINPSGGIKNPFSILSQYRDSMSLYEYAKSNPVINFDAKGLYVWSGPIFPGFKKFCKVLKVVPYYGSLGARAMEMGWCNFTLPKCLIFCETSDEVCDKDECQKKCRREHIRCVARANRKKCTFKFKISGN